MSIDSSSESGDVNCLVTLSESVFVAGSMDGSLRFFYADQGTEQSSCCFLPMAALANKSSLHDGHGLRRSSLRSETA